MFSDVRHAIELGLELTKKNAGELYISDSGHLEFTFSASAGTAFAESFSTPFPGGSLWLHGRISGCYRPCNG